MSVSPPPIHTASTALSDAAWLPSLAADLRYSAASRSVLAAGHIKKTAIWLRERLAVFSIPASQRGLLTALRWSGDAHQDSLSIDLIDEARQSLMGKGRAAMELFSGIVDAWLERLPAAGQLRPLEQCLISTLLLERHCELSDATVVRLWRLIHERTDTGSTRSADRSPSAVLLRLEGQLLRMLVTSPKRVRSTDAFAVREAVREMLERYTDSEGHPQSSLHAVLGPLLATLGRLSTIAERANLKLFDKVVRRSLRTLAIDAITLFPHDARWVPSRTPHEAVNWLESVAEWFGVQEDEATARLLKHWRNAALSRPRKVTKAGTKAARKAQAKKEDRPSLKTRQLRSHQSDTARYACLFGDWRDSRDHVVVRHPQGMLELDAAVGDHALLSGDWTSELTIAGKAIAGGDWACSCWFSDGDADFCELRSEPARGVTLYRQILLSRVDQFVYIADEVRAPGKTDITLSSHLPLTAGWNALADGRSREWQLQQTGCTVRVLPIFAAQNKVVSTDRQVAVVNQQLSFGGQASQTGLYTGIVLDWAPDRRTAPVTWAPLTVCEDRQRMLPHQACAARWRMGEMIWMVLHQASKGDSARTAFGLHSHHETVVARVAGGEYHPLVQVE